MPVTIKKLLLHQQKVKWQILVAVAKKDLKAGERLDCIGGYTVYGVLKGMKIAKKENLVPIGLIDENTKVKKDIKER